MQTKYPGPDQLLLNPDRLAGLMLHWTHRVRPNSNGKVEERWLVRAPQLKRTRILTNFDKAVQFGYEVLFMELTEL